MTGKKFVSIGAALLVAGMVYSAPAAAQATRTWVSGVGDDVNPCSRTAPCKTFAGAISKTAAGGEINCLDSGGFGGVVITKSISLVCDSVEGGVLVSGTNGITVNAAGATVLISGLDIEGVGQGISPGVNGVNILNAANVHVRNTKIRGFRIGYGINFAPTANAQLMVDNVVISESGGTTNPGTSGGIGLTPAAGVSATATITNSEIANNMNVGIRIDSSGIVGSSVTATIANSRIVNNASGILVKTPAGTGSAQFMLVDSTLAMNANFGIIINGTAATARVGNSTITGNGTGVFLNNGASLLSYGDNRLDGNTANGAFSAPLLPKK